MTEKELLEKNRFTKEEYEKMINEQWNQMFENDVKKEQEEIEKKLKKSKTQV